MRRLRARCTGRKLTRSAARPGASPGSTCVASAGRGSASVVGRESLGARAPDLILALMPRAIARGGRAATSRGGTTGPTRTTGATGRTGRAHRGSHRCDGTDRHDRGRSAKPPRPRGQPAAADHPGRRAWSPPAAAAGSGISQRVMRQARWRRSAATPAPMPSTSRAARCCSTTTRRSPRNPASVEKLYTLTTALARFGLDGTLETERLRRGQDRSPAASSAATSTCYGGGDPTFGDCGASSGEDYGGIGTSVGALAAEADRGDAPAQASRAR